MSCLGVGVSQEQRLRREVVTASPSKDLGGCSVFPLGGGLRGTVCQMPPPRKAQSGGGGLLAGHSWPSLASFLELRPFGLSPLIPHLQGLCHLGSPWAWGWVESVHCDEPCVPTYLQYGRDRPLMFLPPPLGVCRLGRLLGWRSESHRHLIRARRGWASGQAVLVVFGPWVRQEGKG